MIKVCELAGSCVLPISRSDRRKEIIKATLTRLNIITCDSSGFRQLQVWMGLDKVDIWTEIIMKDHRQTMLIVRGER